jgi:hypothetical protein
MIRWLWKIIVGAKAAPTCNRECQWQAHAEVDWGFKTAEGKERIRSTVYVLRCATCGDMKNHKVSA